MRTCTLYYCNIVMLHHALNKDNLKVSVYMHLGVLSSAVVHTTSGHKYNMPTQ